jgi:hypothetical protein
MATGAPSAPSHSRIIGIYPRHEPIPKRVWALWMASLTLVACIALAMFAAR